MHVLLALVMFVVMIIAAVVIVGGWVLSLIFRTTSRVISGPRAPRAVDGAGGRLCTGKNCGADNPASARFCRRCGASMEASAPRRVA